jgi:O-antigen/teichoic acid export membrane protein
MAVYLRQVTKIAKWEFQIKRSKELLSDSWPLILSGLAVMLYMRIDQIMLGQMLGDEAVGIYSAAARLSEIWYFIPMIIVSSTFPTLIASRQASIEKYEDMLKRLFRLMFLLALSLAIPISFMSEFIINTLYGEKYNGAAGILVVHIWAGIFVFMGVASSRWFISENLQKNGAFIPGVRPGQSTSEYIGKVLTRITLVGATFLGFIAVLPLAMKAVTGIQSLAIGGTALLIVVSVVIDLMKKIEAQVSMREY